MYVSSRLQRKRTRTACGVRRKKSSLRDRVTSACPNEQNSIVQALIRTRPGSHPTRLSTAIGLKLGNAFFRHYVSFHSGPPSSSVTVSRSMEGRRKISEWVA